MPDYVTVVAIAFVAQLAVLPGEKVQFIIAALSTRYHPLGVVAAAGVAFAGWTAFEIWVGSALQAALPTDAIDAFTAALFLAFAGLLARSAPNPGQDVGTVPDGVLAEVDDVRLPVVDRAVPDALGGYLPIFVLMAAGEVGDKTQLVTIGLAAQYGATSAIWVGEMAAIVPVSLLNAYAFHRFAHLVEARTVHLVAAGLFAFFGLDAVLAILTNVSVWQTAVRWVVDVLVAAV
jgi:putative Ca2+/H+ antiporter (TMEM165/GDT1 family)